MYKVGKCVTCGRANMVSTCGYGGAGSDAGHCHDCGITQCWSCEERITEIINRDYDGEGLSIPEGVFMDHAVGVDHMCEGCGVRLCDRCDIHHFHPDNGGRQQ